MCQPEQHMCNVSMAMNTLLRESLPYFYGRCVEISGRTVYGLFAILLIRCFSLIFILYHVYKTPNDRRDTRVSFHRKWNILRIYIEQYVKKQHKKARSLLKMNVSGVLESVV